MKKIFKYRLPFKEVAEVVLPVGAQIIRIDGENSGPSAGQISIWAIVDPDADLETRTFHLFKTGGEMPDDISEAKYWGCGAIFIQMELMMYVFEYPGTAVPYIAPEQFDWTVVAEKD